MAEKVVLEKFSQFRGTNFVLREDLLKILMGKSNRLLVYTKIGDGHASFSNGTPQKIDPEKVVINAII